MNAALYALTHRGNPGDVAFYAETCRGARSVLELGSGYGRLLSQLAGPKRRVVGLELDPAFIALARKSLRGLSQSKRKSVQLRQGDMRDFAFARRFERVLLPYNSLYCLLTQRDALACFRAAHRALVPGGLLALDVWNAESFHHAALAGAQVSDITPLAPLSRAGRTWDVFERMLIRRARQRLDVDYTYVPRGAGQAREILIRQRYYLPSEIETLLSRAGFALEARYGGFKRRRFTPRSAQLVLLARAI